MDTPADHTRDVFALLGRITDWAKSTKDSIGVPLLVVIALSLVVILALYYGEAVSFLWTLLILLFAVSNLEILREIKSTHDSRLGNSLDQAKADFSAQSLARLQEHEHVFKATFIPHIESISELLGNDFDTSIRNVRALTNRKAKDIRALWRVVEAAVVATFIGCLAIGIVFIGLSAWTAAARTGAIRTP